MKESSTANKKNRIKGLQMQTEDPTNKMAKSEKQYFRVKTTADWPHAWHQRDTTPLSRTRKTRYPVRHHRRSPAGTRPRPSVRPSVGQRSPIGRWPVAARSGRGRAFPDTLLNAAHGRAAQRRVCRARWKRSWTRPRHVPNILARTRQRILGLNKWYSPRTRSAMAMAIPISYCSSIKRAWTSTCARTHAYQALDFPFR